MRFSAPDLASENHSNANRGAWIYESDQRVFNWSGCVWTNKGLRLAARVLFIGMHMQYSCLDACGEECNGGSPNYSFPALQLWHDPKVCAGLCWILMRLRTAEGPRRVVLLRGEAKSHGNILWFKKRLSAMKACCSFHGGDWPPPSRSYLSNHSCSVLAQPTCVPVPSSYHHDYSELLNYAFVSRQLSLSFWPSEAYR